MYVNGQQAEEMVFAAMAGFDALVEHAGVGALQKYLNDSAERAGFAPLEVDNKYGGCTHGTLKAFVKWYAGLPGSTLKYVGDTAFEAMGPMAVPAFLMSVPPYSGLSGTELADAQRGFIEWVQAGRPACGSSIDTADDVLLTDGGVGPAGGGGVTTEEIIAPPQARKLGTLGWVLIGIAVVAVGGTIYHFATRPKMVTPRSLPAKRTARYSLY